MNTFKFKKAINLYCITDAHVGEKHHDEAKFERVIAEIMKDKDAYCMFNGDTFDFTPSGYHNARDEQYLDVNEQIEYMTKLFKKLGKKLLFVRPGNHELRSVNLCGVDQYKPMMENLGVPLLSPGMEQVIFEINGTKLRFVSTHGCGGSSKKIMDNMVAMYRGADAYFSGHTHEFRDLNEGFRTFDIQTGELRKDVPMLIGGSFQCYADYARELNRRATETGCYMLSISEDGIRVKRKIV